MSVMGLDLSMRIGIGYDVHALVADRPLVIGGVTIPYEKGLEGHSDADVLVHAVSDAILGAARLGDIGEHFPDSDPRYENADSIELLRQVKALVDGAGLRVVDIDSVIVAQAPRLTPYRDEMRLNIANALCLSIESVGVKATTTEHLGFEGRGEGIAAQVVALLERCNGPVAGFFGIV
mgnify:CR=1 FL=1